MEMKRRKQNRYRPDTEKRKKVLLRWVKITFCFVCIVAGIPLLSAVFAHSYYALMEAPWPRVEEVEIIGLKHLDRKEILNTLQVPRNASLLSVKMPQLARRLQTLPWLRSAVVRFDMPGRIVVEVIERQPLALVYVGKFMLLDTEGKLFCEGGLGQYPGLLLVTGFSGAELSTGGYLPPQTLKILTNLLMALEKAQNWLPPSQISECHWQGDEGYILYTTQGSIPIRLGTEDFDRKLVRLQRILGLLIERQSLEMVTRIDLDYTNRAYIEGHFPAPKGI